MGLCGAAESFNPEVTAVIPAPRWEKSDSYRLCDKGRADLINNEPPIFTVAPQAWLVPDNLSALSVPSAIPAFFSSTLKRGIMHQTVLFTGQKSPESGKKPTPVPSAERDINNAGLSTSWKLGRVRGDLKSTSRRKQLAENLLICEEQWDWEGKSCYT